MDSGFRLLGDTLNTKPESLAPPVVAGYFENILCFVYFAHAVFLVAVFEVPCKPEKMRIQGLGFRVTPNHP